MQTLQWNFIDCMIDHPPVQCMQSDSRLSDYSHKKHLPNININDIIYIVGCCPDWVALLWPSRTGAGLPLNYDNLTDTHLFTVCPSVHVLFLNGSDMLPCCPGRSYAIIYYPVFWVHAVFW